MLCNCHSNVRPTGPAATDVSHPPPSDCCRTAAETTKGQTSGALGEARGTWERTDRHRRLQPTSASTHDQLQRECCRICACSCSWRWRCLRLCCWRQEQHNRSSGKEHQDCGLHGQDELRGNAGWRDVLIAVLASALHGCDRAIPSFRAIESPSTDRR
jgi:hypothetical protein